VSSVLAPLRLGAFAPLRPFAFLRFCASAL
jgi:hypothetical protein